jgi:sortase A
MTTLLPPGGPTILHQGAVDASPPPGAGEKEPVRIGSSQILLAVSVLIGWFLLYLFVFSGLEQGHAQSALYQELRAELAEGTAPTGAPIDAGSPVALLSIPDAGVDDVVVVEGSRPVQLQDGPGHVLGSVLPGQQGVSVVAGRSLSFGAPFAHVADLSYGAPIVVTTGQGVFAYEVVSVRTKGDPVPAAPAADQSRLTLITSARGAGVGGLQAAQTLYVDATLTDGAVAPGAVATRDTGAELMSAGVDTATLAMLALSLQVLVLALVGFVWAWLSWSRSAAWIAAGPCVLAALWLVSSLGTRLLPALV